MADSGLWGGALAQKYPNTIQGDCLIKAIQDDCSAQYRTDTAFRALVNNCRFSLGKNPTEAQKVACANEVFMRKITESCKGKCDDSMMSWKGNKVANSSDSGAARNMWPVYLGLGAVGLFLFMRKK